MSTPATEFEKNLSLSHFTIENLVDAVYWIDSSGKIVNLNPAAVVLSGYSKEELLNMSVFDLNPFEPKERWANHWNDVKEKKKITLYAKHRRKDGSIHDVEITNNFIEHEGLEYSCSIVRDIHKKRLEEELLRTVSEVTSGLTGQDFFLKLARTITATLGMRYAFVAEFINEEKSRMRTIAFVEGENPLENVEFNTNDSGCRMMMTGKPFFSPRDTYKTFAGAVGVEAYVGAPILHPVTGEVLGHIVATDTNPVSEEKNQTEILKIFAARTGAEMVRMKTEADLEKKNHELRQRIKENEFYHFTIANLREAVFWIDQDGYIWEANDRATELSGYTRDELVTLHVFDVNASVQERNWEFIWNRLKQQKKVIFDAKFRCKDGSLIDIEITQNFLEFEGREYTCSIVRDIRQRKFEEELLHTVSEATSGLVGADFLIELAKHITLTLTMRFALITECANEEKTRLRTLCYVDGDQVLDNIEYETKDLPCEIIMQGKEFFQAKDVQQTFPREKGIESAIGVPIYSSVTGNIIGHILVIDPRPITEEKNQTAILKIFASRAGAEIERMRAEKELEKANAELKIRLQEIEDLKNRLQLENKYLQEEIKLTYNFEEIVTQSKSFQKVLRQIEQVASTDATVLILGESGTGKELIARAVHNISNRNKRPLVKVNCAALPANLIESELFGHEKGAFTGAMERKIGRFELSDGGTIFLDEIGELPIDLQSKLLRVLQEGEFERLGNPKTMKVNVRVIAATNRELEKAIEKKEFREDLYYRLYVFPIVCPPLRDRKEDIPLLVKHFLKKYEGKVGKRITGVPKKIIEALQQYDWPGNIRELENLIERAMILATGDSLTDGEWIPQQKNITKGGKDINRTLEDVEKDHIIEVLKKTNWRVSGDKGAAKILGMNATTLEARMKRMGIKRKSEE